MKFYCTCERISLLHRGLWRINLVKLYRLLKYINYADWAWVSTNTAAKYFFDCVIGRWSAIAALMVHTDFSFAIFCRILYTLSTEMPMISAISRTFIRRSSITVWWIFKIIPCVVTSTRLQGALHLALMFSHVWIH